MNFNQFTKHPAATPAPEAAGRARIKDTDMDVEMQHFATSTAIHAVDTLVNEKEITAYIKKQFTDKYGHVWHCIAGRDFGLDVTHEGGHFIFFYVEELAVLLFKTPIGEEE